MRARVVVFPMKGRNWCFSRSIDPSLSAAGSASSQSSTSTAPSTLRDLWKSLSNSKPMGENAELLVDFSTNKMNNAWTTLGKSPEGSFKNKVYGVGLWLLSRVKPSELFLKSISKEVTEVEITYPTSLNARLVRRRLRHIARRGTIIHRKLMYGSATMLPLTTAFMVLPLPNIPFFWLLFRTYSHWRAHQGSERLLKLVSDGSAVQMDETRQHDDPSSNGSHKPIMRPAWILQPSKELEELLRHAPSKDDGINESSLDIICKNFYLNPQDITKYKTTV